MPIYQYKCNNCSRITDDLRSIRDRELPLNCPFCGATTSFVLSIFSICRHTKTARKPEPLPTKSASTKTASGPIGIDIHGSTSAIIKDCHFQNLGTGISAPASAKLDIVNPTFSNVNQPLEIRNE